MNPSGAAVDGGPDQAVEDMTVDSPVDTDPNDGEPPAITVAPDAMDVPDAPDAPDGPTAPGAMGAPDASDAPPDGGRCSLGGRSARLPCAAELWPGGQVPYRWVGFWSEGQRSAVRLAMADWTHLTDDVIQFAEDAAASTAVGLSLGSDPKAVAMPGAGAGKILELNPADSWGLRHILGHLLGLPDAHQRADRDRYLTMQDWSDCGMTGSHRYSYGRCEDEPRVRSRGPSRGAYGPYDPVTVMQPPSTCRQDSCDMRLQDGRSLSATTAPYVTRADASALFQMYAETQSWSRFRPAEGGTTAAPSILPAARPALWFWDGSLFVALRGADGRLLVKRDAQKPTPWTRVGEEVLNSDVAAVGATSHSEVAAVRNGELVLRRLDASGWQPWQSLGAPPGTGPLSVPALVMWDDVRLDVFIIRDGKLFHRARPEPDVWSDYIELASGLTGNPAAASWGPGRLDVVAVRADDRSIWHAGWEDGFDWANDYLGGPVKVGTDLAAASFAHARLSIFAVFDSGLLNERRWAPPDWRPWAPIGGHLPATSPAATPAPGAIHLAAMLDSPGRSGTVRELWHRVWSECPAEPGSPAVLACSVRCPCPEGFGGCASGGGGRDCMGALVCAARAGSVYGLKDQPVCVQPACASQTACKPGCRCAATGTACAGDEDCAPGLVCESVGSSSSSRTCFASTCRNGLRDIGELGVDCGGVCRSCNLP